MSKDLQRATSSRLRRPSDYPNPATMLKTQSGNFLVNYHGFCLFVNPRMTYLVWEVTKKNGQLPPTQEFGRLKKANCPLFILTAEQERQVWKIVRQLMKNPFFGLDRIQTFTAKAGMAKRLAEKSQQLHAGQKKIQPAKKLVFKSFADLRATA